MACWRPRLFFFKQPSSIGFGNLMFHSDWSYPLRSLGSECFGIEGILRVNWDLEEGQVKMQYKLEEEEEARAALMSIIQRLTKLILVSKRMLFLEY
ncbi:hypothetical protein V2J09_006593 [Rumex salicifolius]